MTIFLNQNKRLHQLQQKYEPSIPRHMHFLRLAVLREFSYPDGLLPVIRDPCQFYSQSKIVKQQYGIVQGYRYYRKLREVTGTPMTTRPDVAVCPTTPKTPQASRLHSARGSLSFNKVKSKIEKFLKFGLSYDGHIYEVKNCIKNVVEFRKISMTTRQRGS